MNKHIATLVFLTYATMVSAHGARAMSGYSASNFSLELDGSMAGHLRSVEGGSVSAPVIEEVAGQDQFVRKHIGAPVYGDFNLQLGVAMPKAIRDWIESTMKMNYQRKSGAVIASDFNYEKMKSYEFHDALLTAITFPRCDAADTDPGYLNIRFAPELTIQAKASGKAEGDNPKGKQSQFLAKNFRLAIGGLDCAKIVKIESLTVKSPLSTSTAGDTRDYFKEPGKLEFPNLKITFSAASVESWQAWHEAFVIEGKNGQQHEKTGVLEYLSPDLKSTLLKLEFEGLGIYRLEQQKQDGNTDAMARYTAELYCEKIILAP